MGKSILYALLLSLGLYLLNFVIGVVVAPIIGKSVVLVIAVLLVTFVTTYFAAQYGYRFFKQKGMSASGYYFGVLVLIFYCILNSIDKSMQAGALSLNFDFRAVAALLGAGVAGRSK